MEDRFIHNNRKLKERRRDLRNNATLQESVLWKYLRTKKLGLKFLRQHSIGSYIVDFYCPHKRLIIEIDGSQHGENEEYDLERTCYLEAQGFKVVRFWNSEIDFDVTKVIKIIQECINLP
ncbi:MAG: DUF559 domain-containing protein [bacterium]|nr:DUF559 domain-containing protein [bacterium]